MRKFALFLLLTLNLLFTVGLCATENSITVKVTGQGLNQTEALEDGLRNAVRKVVGTYVVTQSKLQEEDFDESIYINADAVVTQHKVLKKRIEDGLVVLDIEATVVKNDLLKYIVKKESTNISSTDLGNLLNRRKALATAEKSLEYIFSNYAQQLYQAKKVGDFSLAADDDVENDTISVEMTYEVSFNDQAYQRLKKRLQNLLSKVALAQESGTTDKYDNIFYSWSNSFIVKFNKSEASKSWATGTKIIAFVDEYWNGQTKMFKYHFYAVPNQIYEKIASLTSSFGVIVFDFNLAGREKPLKRYIAPDLNFFWADKYAGRNTIVLKNWMYISVPDQYSKQTTKSEFKKTWKFSEDQIRAMKSCTLKMYSGQQARYIWYTAANPDEYRIKDLAWEGYLPAMLAMAEQFEVESWYHNAALMGIRHAQQKVNWQNGGLGFEITFDDNKAIVYSAPQGMGVKKGMILKSINGSSVPKYVKDFSNFIGSFSPGESVSVEFYNGKIINVIVQD